MDFRGIPASAIDFYQRLDADNSKVFWEANKATFVDSVRQPMKALCDELVEFGPFHMFRPNNDVRFSKGKPPYKTHQGAFSESEGGAGYYVQLSASGLMVGTGYYAMAKDQLERFRTAVDAEGTGTEIAIIVGRLPANYAVGAMSELKTAPRGVAKDHPRIELMRRKGLMISRNFGAPKWLHTKQAATRVRDFWLSGSDLNHWLDAYVGPSTLEPEGFFG
ncbi:MAG TPA: DUF2461 domain-containing protein [Ilumatobacter sp.]|nr:DUF2461 domain-containing protein [Ilumatobacter sp.]